MLAEWTSEILSLSLTPILCMPGWTSRQCKQVAADRLLPCNRHDDMYLQGLLLNSKKSPEASEFTALDENNAQSKDDGAETSPQANILQITEAA